MKMIDLPSRLQIGEMVRQRKDVRWWLIFVAGLTFLWIWDANELAPLSYQLLTRAILNTFIGAALAVLLSLLFGWGISLGIYSLEQHAHRRYTLSAVFFLNLIRSLPQMIWLLIGYILLTHMIQSGILATQLTQILWMAFVLSTFCSLEVFDLMSERIAYFRQSDYFHAMLCCGMKESRILNIEILWKSSRSHLLHKIVSLFGTIIMLQCSIDFIISVGLSLDVSLSNVPVTLGSLLAKLDSKQDILALGTCVMDPFSIPQLFLQHLQGVSVAFIIVFTILCLFQIADGMVRQYDL